MKIGLVSDTHDQRQKIIDALAVFKSENVDLIIHLGDWVAPFSAALFKSAACKVIGVFGNNDGDRVLHRQKNPFIKYEDDYVDFEFAGRKIFATHGHIKGLLDKALSGSYDAVFSGHSHVSHVKMQGRTLWVNPGSLVDRTDDFISGMSIAVYDAVDNSARIIPL